MSSLAPLQTSAESLLPDAFAWHLLQFYLRAPREPSEQDRFAFARRIVREPQVTQIVVHRIDEIAALAASAGFFEVASEQAGILADALEALPRAIVPSSDRPDPTRIREAFYQLLARHESTHPTDQSDADEPTVARRRLAAKMLTDATVGLAAELPLALPPFETSNLARSKQRLSHFCEREANSLIRRVAGIEWQAAQGGRHGNPQWAREEAGYRLALARELDYVELFWCRSQPRGGAAWPVGRLRLTQPAERAARC